MAMTSTPARHRTAVDKPPRSTFDVRVEESDLDSNVGQVEISATCYFQTPDELLALLRHFTERLVSDIETGDWKGV